jgi:hypothetical protein
VAGQWKVQEADEAARQGLRELNFPINFKTIIFSHGSKIHLLLDAVTIFSHYYAKIHSKLS